MERLCDEVLQLVFYELPDPSSLTLVSQRFHRFSQDPYVRAHYFLNHYGPVEAMYYALGRGKVVTERVLDILLSSGAHLSRYLIQVAIHHYFYTHSHFVKTNWVRHVPLHVIAYFLKLAQQRYGEIPWAKGEDDGSIFTTFLKESRLPAPMKTVTWETIKTLMETYNFIPFSSRDPVMSQFPLALAIEPRLLPYAVANGFSLDYKYRDFVFRKMFERPSTSSETRAEEIADNVRELCKLDSSMFVTRTVAAEVCMEAKTNDIGYAALKLLENSGDLRFELPILVEDLLRTFLTTRSICSFTTGDILLHLFADFPSSDVSVRLVVLVLVFLAADNLSMSTTAVRAKLESLDLTPVTRKDVFNMLVNPFVERYNSILEFAQKEVGVKADGAKGMSPTEIESLVEDVAVKCLEIACKGKLLKRLLEAFPPLKTTLTYLILQKYQINLEDLPSWEAGMEHPPYVAKLCRDFLRYGVGEVHTLESLVPETDEQVTSGRIEGAEGSEEARLLVKPVTGDADLHETERTANLGEITQESLTTMIRHDEATPIRSRRRIVYSYGPSDLSWKLRYPHDPTHVGKWAKSLFGARSSVMAIFMTHAVINDNCSMLHHYLMYNDGGPSNTPSTHIPITLKHFQLLARLGRTPNFYLWHDIEVGAEFYMDEYEYMSKSDVARSLFAKQKVKMETSQCAALPASIPSPSLAACRGKKRPRRSAAVPVRSYAVPDSDDEAIAEEHHSAVDNQDEHKPSRETNLQLWIKHLTQLLKAETRKYNEMKKRLEKTVFVETKFKIQKNDFVKSLTTNLRTLRKIESENRMKYAYEETVEQYSDDEADGNYRSRRTKRRKAVYA
ncbi:hypothetical protein GALMADRAFT_220831 [Galerina marginata CBS 339.88]|uniref:Uncharacterized protein n=1 Tax=Galerina marginata (strain CBS 339.88) TaxID=685588 RepID=A0A067THW9_GALM3|nr:hypothetical protein GALMADRAFT_220831 [Galerina marginata CBS 339.88]